MTTAIQWFPEAAGAGFTDHDLATFKGQRGVRLELLAAGERVTVLGGALGAGQVMLATQEFAPDEVSEAGPLRWLKVPIEQLWPVIADLLPQLPALTSAARTPLRCPARNVAKNNSVRWRPRRQSS